MKTILTFGVFDLLHIGHIKLFQRAKQFGDKLVVAIQDDEYVSKYKSNVECFYSTEQRAYMVSSIKYVDDIIIYRDVDKDISKIEFDILALGEDQNHVGFKKAIQWCYNNNKEVVILQRTQGISSSMIKEYTKNN
ncbi:MAG: adenylyltransferase/cytidyltransferase family protein [Paludibacteraceae bacterium]|nr:adenylyltransferase/cytidyltransferase family protein [Paludibacteraceae bacterium]